MKSAAVAAFIGIVSILAASASKPAPQSYEPDYKYPVIKEHGRIVPAKDAAVPPPPNAKIVFDITGGELDGGVIKGLDRVALYINLSAAHDVSAGQLQLALVLHGDATRAALGDEAYRRHADGKRNPNLELIGRLKKAGVEVYVCAQALAHHGFRPADVADPVTIAASAATVNAAFQLDGYAYIPFG